MTELKDLFSELDKEARQVCTLKDLLAGLLVRQYMDDKDKCRLARTFIDDTSESLMEMKYLINTHLANLVKKEVMK